MNIMIIGFTNILEASRHFKIEHFIYASSSSVYGANTTKPFSTSDNVDHPLSLYAATKKSNELMAHTYSHLFNLPTTGLRFFTVYGPWGRPDMALFKFTKAIVNDEPIDVYNHGNMMRDFTYVDDIVEAISRLVEKPAQPNPEWSGDNPDPSSSYAPYKIYNIGNNSPVRLMEFVEAIENKLGKVAKKNYMDLQPGDVPETYANVDDLFNNIDFKPETTIQDEVNKFVDNYLEKNLVKASSNHIEIKHITFLKKKVDFLLKRKQIEIFIDEHITGNEIVIIRLPSEIGYIAMHHLKKRNIDFGIELVGDPWE